MSLGDDKAGVPGLSTSSEPNSNERGFTTTISRIHTNQNQIGQPITTTIVTTSTDGVPVSTPSPTSTSPLSTSNRASEVSATPSLKDPDLAIEPSEGSKGLGTGPIAGIAVGVGLLAILVGVGLFFFLRKQRRAKSRKHGGVDDPNTGMMESAISGKQYESDDTSGSGVHHSPQNATHPMPSGPVPVPHQQEHSYQLVDNVSSSPYSAPLTTPVPATTIEQDLVDRPVSPPLPDDIPESSRGASPAQADSRGLGVGATGDGRGSVVSNEEDPEMQWILEEERRARERREQHELRGIR